jgi:hypothetical protein
MPCSTNDSLAQAKGCGRSAWRDPNNVQDVKAGSDALDRHALPEVALGLRVGFEAPASTIIALQNELSALA